MIIHRLTAHLYSTGFSTHSITREAREPGRGLGREPEQAALVGAGGRTNVLVEQACSAVTEAVIFDYNVALM